MFWDGGQSNLGKGLLFYWAKRVFLVPTIMTLETPTRKEMFLMIK